MSARVDFTRADAAASTVPCLPALEVEDLSFTYPGAEVPVLNSLSWEVPEGSFALLVGGTGSGKSTLLSLLKPEIAPTGEREGRLLVLGRPVSDYTPAQSARAIGYVFQNPDNQLVCESVWHEMAFCLENLGMEQGAMRRRVAETSYFLGMEDWFRHDVDTLSGGRKQLSGGALTRVDDLEALRERAALLPRVPAAGEEGADAGRVAVELRRAWFRYDRGDDWVLRNLDLSVRAGRIHALVGGNGCGKSTLLSLMAGVRRLDQGKLVCAERARALLPQDPHALFAEETVDAELMEWASAAGYGQREANEMLDALGLGACAALHPYDLSGGQQQLLALGKLLLTKPRLLLLDEPTKGLDLPARRAIAQLLREQGDAGVTMVVATHDLDFVSQVADDVSMVFDGEIACTAPREEFFRGNVYYRP